MSELDEALQQESLKMGGNPFKPGIGVDTTSPFSIGTIGNTVSGSGPSTATITRDPTDTKEVQRGDYIVKQGQSTVVPNSATDIVYKYLKSDAAPRQGLSVSDWFNAIKTGAMALAGAPTKSDNFGELLLTGAISQAAKNSPPLIRGLWVAGSVLESINDAQDKYLQEYLNQDFNYEITGEFEKTKDGKRIFKPNYSKMAGAGPESGEAVLSASDTSKTGASMSEDNQLKISVSPIFAKSDEYADALKTISEAYGSLSKEQADEVVDKDTGMTRIDSISNYIKSLESNYLYNTIVVKDIKEKAPTASDKSLELALDVSKIGFFPEKMLEKTDIVVYDDKNTMVEINAKEYLDSISNMDKLGREDYMVSLGNRIADSNISDDEKAILYAQSMALYSASDSDGPYKGMYLRGLDDEVGEAREIFSGMTWNELFDNRSLTTFRQNEFSAGTINLATSIGSIFALTKTTNLLEGAVRNITPKLSEWSGSGGLRGAIESTIENADDFGIKQASSIAGKTLAQAGYQVVADAMYDSAKAIPYALKNSLSDYNFIEELKTDAAIDFLITYGPAQFVSDMESPKYERRLLVEDTKTGEELYKSWYDIKKDAGQRYNIVVDEHGFRDVKMAEVTGEELAKRRADTIDKLTNSKVGMAVEKLFFDKNAAMSKLAVQALKVSSKFNFQRMLRYSGDIRQVTSDTLREFMGKNTVGQHWDTLKTAFRDIGANKLKDISKEDWNYIKAVTNEYRFLEKNKGDKDAEKAIKEFYKDGKNGVSKERAKQLDGLMSAMRGVAADILDFYVEKGLMTQKEVDKLRNSPGYENGMYLPMYLAPGRKLGRGGSISQNRALYKKVKNAEALISLDDIDNPLGSLKTYIDNAMRAVAINDRALAIRDAASLAGVGIHIVEDTGGAMKGYKNLLAYDKGFRKIYSDIRSKVKNSYLSLEDWQKQNSGFVMRSKALKTANELDQLRKDGIELRKQLKRANYKYKKANSKLEAETIKNLKQASLFDDSGKKRSRRPKELINAINENNKAAQELQDVKTLIAENKQAQLFTIDRIKDYTKMLMKRAANASKSGVKLELDSYLNVQVTNALKEAIKSNDSTGKIQNILNDAVTKANPWVDPEVVIRRRTEAAALRYRNKIFDDLKAQDEKNKRNIAIDKINAAADQITDKILSKITGEKETEVTFLDDEGYATKLLDNYGKNTIRYMLDGKEYRMVLSGKGAEELVSEFYAPEFTLPTTTIGKVGRSIMNVGNRIAQGKRYLTTAWNFLRAPLNVIRDFSRGIVTTHGQILISPKLHFNGMAKQVGAIYGEKAMDKVMNGIMLAEGAVDEGTLTASLRMPRRNAPKSMVRALTEPDGNAFVRFVFDLKAGDFGKALSAVQDYGESFTRKAAMEAAYSRELARQQAKGRSVNDAIKRATEEAYFAGREATANFFRRGALISKVAQQVPYLTQKFAGLESFKYSYLNDPIGVSRALRTTVSAYTTLIAIALSNEESRKKYYLLSEYDRANNIIIPLTNGMIMTLPLDEVIAGFLTPYRRMVETLNGVDPEAFYLCFAEGLMALSPIDLSGFSEGDGFNVVRGFEKIGSEFIPTWAQPIIEAYTGRDLYYGSNISVDSDYTGMVSDNWTPTPGELTTKSKDSKTLAMVSDHTGIPQWMLQNYLSEYGGTVGQYLLNTIDKLSGATQEKQGGKEWSDSIFKPYTGADSDDVASQFMTAINSLKEEKKRVQNEIKTLSNKINGASGEEKAELIKQRQEKISGYGIRVTDTLNQYLSAYEITGGLSKKIATQAWFLYNIYDESSNRDLYVEDSVGDYYTDKATSWNRSQAISLASKSGADTIVRSPVSDYYETYAEQAFKNTLYGDPTSYVAIMDDIINEKGLRDEYYDTISPLIDKYYKEKNWDAKDDLLKAWDKKVMKTIVAEFSDEDLTEVLKKSEVLDLLDNYIKPPSSWETNKYGRYFSAPRLNKSRGFAPSYIQAVYDELKKEKK